MRCDNPNLFRFGRPIRLDSINGETERILDGPVSRLRDHRATELHLTRCNRFQSGWRLSASSIQGGNVPLSLSVIGAVIRQ